MTAAPARVAAVAVSVAAGFECVELIGLTAQCLCGTEMAVHPVMVNGSTGSEPSGGGTGHREALDDVSARRHVWSRRDWKSTAALTIGKPPRALRVG